MLFCEIQFPRFYSHDRKTTASILCWSKEWLKVELIETHKRGFDNKSECSMPDQLCEKHLPEIELWSRFVSFELETVTGLYMAAPSVCFSLIEHKKNSLTFISSHKFKRKNPINNLLSACLFVFLFYGGGPDFFFFFFQLNTEFSFFGHVNYEFQCMCHGC